MIYSLTMQVERIDGVWFIDAPWLDELVCGPTFEAAYSLALAARRTA